MCRIGRHQPSMPVPLGIFGRSLWSAVTNLPVHRLEVPTVTRHIRHSFVGPHGVGGPRKCGGVVARGVAGIYGTVRTNTIPSLRSTTTPAVTMKRNTSSSIFQDGRLRPGTYKIKNIVSKTYVDTKDDLRELCGRPSTCLEKGEGQVRDPCVANRRCS